MIAKAINQRLHYTAACDWYLEAPDHGSRELIPYFDTLLRRIEGFSAARLNLSRATIEGTRWARIIGRSGVVNLLGDRDESPQRWWWIEQLADIDKRRLRLDREPADHHGDNDSDAPGDNWFWNLYDPLADEWRRVEHPEHFIRHTACPDEGSLGYGRSLLESLWFYWRAKTALFGYMCEGAERFAFPWIVARIGAGSELNQDPALGSAFPAADERADALIAALEKMRRASVLVLDSEDQVQTVDLSGQGNALILDLVRYVDRCMVELILGASMPTGSGTDTGGGSYARAQVERESTDDLLQFDRESLEDTLTRDLIGALWRYNRPAFAALGLDHLNPPCLRLGRAPRRKPDDAIALIERCARIGVPLLSSEVYDALGFAPPTGTPEVLAWKAGE
ncbi:MAG: DUF935 family protein [Planctomycetota bacterium]